MTREINFRGQRINTREWVYGNLVQNDEFCYITHQPNIIFVSWDSSGEYTFNENFGGLIKVIPKTVGQFTGLHDKNGKEIYNRDIVNKEYHNFEISDSIGVVHMGRGEDSDGNNCGVWLGWKAGDSSLLDIHKKCEVIGNIYENPELLEGGD